MSVCSAASQEGTEFMVKKAGTSTSEQKLWKDQENEVLKHWAEQGCNQPRQAQPTVLGPSFLDHQHCPNTPQELVPGTKPTKLSPSQAEITCDSSTVGHLTLI